jgi:hypothetical protein
LHSKDNQNNFSKKVTLAPPNEKLTNTIYFTVESYITKKTTKTDKINFVAQKIFIKIYS